MELKEYQQGVLHKIDRYLATLAEQTDKVEKAKALIAEQGLDIDIVDPCQKSWDHLNKERLLPYLRDKDGNTFVAHWLARHDGLNRSIPNVCLKVPTGGGKTLLAACALDASTLTTSSARPVSCSGWCRRTPSTARPGNTSPIANTPTGRFSNVPPAAG